jgi:hypothetical protein
MPISDLSKLAKSVHIAWDLRTPPPHLSENQRFESDITAIVDVQEFLKRPDLGRLALYIEIQDQERHIYQNHRSLGLSNAE